ncbi:hypothetical protein GDO86_000281 [Hymenochirus boettgeri]|uniref:TIR domain-containing protein n=1 Tax=Hymenochirus boettgeri TaxID=247094 RepID=A0A8T2KDV0_9PIPI|nr:hypothetical protein GDO86_000281 [Hymenochirus boettgeri]
MIVQQRRQRFLTVLQIFFICIFAHSLGAHLHIIESHTANLSHQSLSTVPTNLSSLTTILDISFNIIETLEKNDFDYMAELKVLNASHNRVQYLHSDIFQFNTQLEHIDFTHNQLRNISGTFPQNLRHLDISFNNFKTTSVCRRFGNLFLLEYLGLGASQITKSDFEYIFHLQLKEVFLELKSSFQYENGSLLLLNTKKLRLYLPSNIKEPYLVLLDAVNTSTILELWGIAEWSILTDPDKYISSLVKNSKVIELELRNINIQWKNVVLALQYIWHSSVEVLRLNEVRLNGNINEYPFNYTNTLMKAVSVQEVNVGVFKFDQSVVYRLFSDMNIKRLSMNFASLLFMVCPSQSSTFQNIDFSNNALTDDLFQDCHTLIHLQMLTLRQNKIEKLSKVSFMTKNMPSLKDLDVSHNLISYGDEQCNWSQSVLKLNLAFNSLTASVFKCLPKNIKTLILQNNEITNIPNDITYLDGLEDLNLSFNRLVDLVDCTNLSSLSLLNVVANQILYPSLESIQSCSKVKHINAGHNPYQCNCELRMFINQEKDSPGRLIGWPETYICKYPDDVKGKMLKYLYLPEITCNVFILVPVIIFPIIFTIALIFGLCKYFDAPWFLKMICQYTRTRHRRIRVKNKDYQSLPQDVTFNAFISYSEHDASWVKNIFLPNIERSDDHIRICQHERDFIPGKSIVENIINCIEKSYKSIFILSPNFVQSEWCHYELYFAHHKLFTENNDNLILVLLEPIPQYLIPSKYYKLKTLMAKRTYLEWPKEKSKHSLFWANLRAAINVDLSHSENENNVPSLSESS